MVQDYIESQYLKAHIVCKILRMTALLESAQIGVSSDDCLDQHVVNSLLNLFAVMAQFIEGLVNWRKGSFVALVAFSGFLIKNEVRTQFIDCVVG